jgi:hypothetical protein
MNTVNQFFYSVLIDIIFGNPHMPAYVKPATYSLHLTEICHHHHHHHVQRRGLGMLPVP